MPLEASEPIGPLLRLLSWMKTPTLESVLDEYLVTASQGGDRRAMQMLVRRWNGRLTGLALRYVGDGEVARDVAQEAWVGIIRGLPRLRDPAHFRAWSYRIVANKARDFVRREQSRRRAMDGLAAVVEDGDDVAGDPPSPLREALDGMSKEQRALLSLYYGEGLSVREIGRVLGVPEGTVKSRLFHARKTLKATLDKETT